MASGGFETLSWPPKPRLAMEQKPCYRPFTRRLAIYCVVYSVLCSLDKGMKDVSFFLNGEETPSNDSLNFLHELLDFLFFITYENERAVYRH